MLDNVKQVYLAMTPDLNSPHHFTIGQHNITYLVTDRSGLTNTCVFTVTVIGKYNLTSYKSEICD